MATSFSVSVEGLFQKCARSFKLFPLRKSLKYLLEIKAKFEQIIDRFSDFQAETMDCSSRENP
jgi:hypothetical protein